MGVMNCFFVEG